MGLTLKLMVRGRWWILSPLTPSRLDGYVENTSVAGHGTRVQVMFSDLRSGQV